MNIFFHSGINLDISLAEIKSFFNIDDKSLLVLPSGIIKLELNTDKNDIKQIQDRLGGIIKISLEIGVGDINEIEKLIVKRLETTKESNLGKIRFGINSYCKNINLKGLLLKSKKNIKGLRFLNNNFQNLSSIVTKKQIINKNGIELNIFEYQNKYCLSETLSIQDIESYSKRDYSKPKRDAKVGMLPPKLAQILINLGGKQNSIWDPFCGLGVIPIEAILMGIKNIIYSDIEKNMVEYTKENIEWAIENYDLNVGEYKFESFVKDVKEFSEIKTDSVITEGFLGTPLKKYGDLEHINSVDKILSNIWKEAINNFYKNNIKKIVLCIPAFAQNNGKVIFLSKTLENLLQSKYTLKVQGKNARGTLLYRKDNQFVFREIVILELK